MELREKIARIVSGGISLFSPAAAQKYYMGHLRLSSFYKAGSLKGPNGRFAVSPKNRNLSLAKEARIIRQRARKLVNDSPNMDGAVQKIVNNVVFTGIKPQVKDAKNEAEEKRIEKLWENWAKTQDFWLLQRQVMRSLIIDGGCFCHFYWDKNNAFCPLGVELISLDRLDETINGRQENGNFAFRGIELDSHKKVAAYHIKEDDEYAFYMGIDAFNTSKRIEQGDIFLLYYQKDIGQLLPVSWLHSVIVTMHSFNEYQETEQIAAQLAASFAIFLKQSGEYMGPSLSGSSLSGGTDAQGKQLNVNNFIESGRIDVLPPGTEIQVAENTRPSANFSAYSKQCQKNASTGIGMSYESFSNDFSDASYSSVRQAILEERLNYKVMQEFLVRIFLEKVWDKFIDTAKTFGMLPREEVSVYWQKPGWSWVDPVKDAQAMNILYEKGFKSGHMICGELGIDYDEVQRQLEKEEEDRQKRAQKRKSFEKQETGQNTGQENGVIKESEEEHGQNK